MIGLGLLSPYALAGSVADTTICTPVNQAFKAQAINLSKGHQQLFGLYNKSAQPVSLRSINRSGTAQAGWDSHLQSDHWSALALANKPLTLTCLQGKKVIACNQVLTLCQFRQATFQDKARGSYWAAENVAGSDVIAAIATHGIDADG